MILLDDLVPGMMLKGIRSHTTVTHLAVTRHGAESTGILFKDAAGSLGSQLVYRADTDLFEVVPAASLPWSFTANGAAFRLVSEAYRIRLAYLFDPLIAVHTSLVDPLPHQITAAYETMLKKQPLRYLLADDPGAGKTIMRSFFKNCSKDSNTFHTSSLRTNWPVTLRRRGKSCRVLSTANTRV